MKQTDMFASPDPIKAPEANEVIERDLFGNPIARKYEPDPTYRPRKPAQQNLNLTPDAFTLTE